MSSNSFGSFSERTDGEGLVQKASAAILRNFNLSQQVSERSERAL